MEKNDEITHLLLFAVITFIVSKGATIIDSWRRTTRNHVCDLLPPWASVFRVGHDDIRPADWRTQSQATQRVVRSTDAKGLPVILRIVAPDAEQYRAGLRANSSQQLVFHIFFRVSPDGQPQIE